MFTPLEAINRLFRLRPDEERANSQGGVPPERDETT
jgi:hypothetical protein